MKKALKKAIKKVGAFILAAALLFPVALPARAAGAYGKEEVVYVKLGYDGAVSSVYIVNSFDAAAGTVVADSGNYLSVQNLTTTEPITQKNGEVKFTAPEGKFYYEGVLKTLEIPWNLSVIYTLDGHKISGDTLAGKSGHLQIGITLRQKESANAAYREHYAMQASLSLDSELCKNILAPDATVASVGDQKQLSYIILPNKNKDITITADVENFEMSGISINMVPLSLGIDSPDISELRERLTELQDGAVELDDGAVKLKDGATELEDGVYKLRDGVDELYDGAVKLRDGAVELDDGAAELSDGVSDLKDGAVKLNDGVSELKDGAASLYDGTGELRDGVIELQTGLPELSDGAVKLDDGAKKLLNGSVDLKDGVVKLVDGADTLIGGAATFYSGIASLNSKSGELTSGSAAVNSGLQQLALGVSAIDTGSLTNLTQQAAMLQEGSKDFKNGLEGWIAAYGGILDDGALSALNMLAVSYAQIDGGVAAMTNAVSGQAAGLPQLADGITALASQYKTLDSAIAAYTGGVGQLYSGFGEMQSGIWSLSSGLIELQSGAAELHNGSRELYDGTADLKTGVTELNDGVIKLYDGSTELRDGALELQDGVEELQEGVIELNDGVVELQDGAVKLRDGTTELVDGTSDLYDGVLEMRDKMVDLIDGTHELKDGTLDLTDGTGELRERTATMDSDVDDEIETMLDEYRNTDFTPVSFAHAGDDNIRSVQFVMKTADITIVADNAVQVIQESTPLTLWQRFLNLFPFFKKY